jgi:sugar lactone lactonase YvrE
MHLPRCEQVLEPETIACPCCQGQLHKIGRGEVGSRRTFFTIEQGLPDGIRLDTDGNVWTSSVSNEGVVCVIGRIHVPEPVLNLCLGGP